MKKDSIQAAVIGGVVATAVAVGVSALQDKKTRSKIAKAATNVIKSAKKSAQGAGKKAGEVSENSQKNLKTLVGMSSQEAKSSATRRQTASR